MAIYHFSLYSLRREDQSTLYFVLFCVLVSVRLISTGTSFINFIFPTSFIIIYKLQLLSFYLAVPLFLMFVTEMYTDEFSEKIVRISQALGVILGAIILLASIKISMQTLITYEIITILICTYTIYGLFLATLRMREGTVWVIGGFAIIFFAVTKDILFANRMIQTDYYTPIGLFFFIFAQSFFLSLRFSNAFSENRTLSENLLKSERDLSRHKDNLEHIVKEV